MVKRLVKMRKSKCVNQIENINNRKKSIIDEAFSFLLNINFMNKH